MIYIFSYCLSLFFSFYTDITSRNLGKFFLFIAILFPVLLFGLRDVSIGTDTALYVYPTFELATQSDSWKSFSNIVSDSTNIEFLYVVWNFVVSRITHDYSIFLIFTGFLLYIPFVYSLYRHKEKLVLWFALFILYFVFFRESLNALRQYMAMSFCMLAFSYLIDNSYKKSLLFSIIAYGFHHSALIFLLIIGLWILCSFRSAKISSLKIKFILTSLFFAMLSFLANIVSALENIGAIDSRYEERYLTSELYGTNIPISLFALCILNLIIYKQISKFSQSSLKVFFEYILILSLLCCFLGTISTFLVRIGSYFQICTIFIFPIMYKEYIGYYDIKILRFHLAFLIAYWILTVVIANLGQTYPYKSLILGI